MFPIEVGESLLIDGRLAEVIDVAYDEFDPDRAIRCVVRIGEEVRGIDLTLYEESHVGN